MGMITVHIHFIHHKEVHAVVLLAKLANLCAFVRFLRTELITGKANHDQALIVVFGVQFLQSCKLWCKAALACSVYDKQNLTFKVLKMYDITSQIIGGKFIDARHKNLQTDCKWLVLTGFKINGDGVNAISYACRLSWAIGENVT